MRKIPHAELLDILESYYDKFNQPGFMGGLGRAGMAIAPGMGSDMILNQIRQSMFPEVNQ
jgi:hypothetical protein